MFPMWQYTIGMWELIGLVILPFLFGLLFGIHVYEKKMIIKMIKDMRPEDMERLVKESED